MLHASSDDGTHAPDRPVLDCICTECNCALHLYADGRPFTTIEQACAFVIAWARGKACMCRKDDNHLKGL